MHLHGTCPESGGGVKQKVVGTFVVLKNGSAIDIERQVTTIPGRSYTLKWTAFTGHWDNRQDWRMFLSGGLAVQKRTDSQDATLKVEFGDLSKEYTVAATSAKCRLTQCDVFILYYSNIEHVVASA